MRSDSDADEDGGLYLESEMEHSVFQESAIGATALFSTRCPSLERPNEDAAARLEVEGGLLLAVSDGAGGQRGGAIASRTVLESLESSVSSCDGHEGLREAVLAAIERANEALLDRGAGSGATLAVALVDKSAVRFFHVGDSAILVIGQRGKLRFHSTMHSPVGYALEAGVIDEAEAIQHEERHIVSNLVGTKSMSIEMSPEIPLKPFDTVVLGSDGLFDNLMTGEIVEAFRKGRLDRAADSAVQACLARMAGEDASQPSKPDDLSIIAFRRGRPR